MRDTVGGDTPNIRAICAAVFRPDMTTSAISRRLVSSSFLRRPPRRASAQAFSNIRACRTEVRF
jgi:hypothetical protein